MRGRALVVLVGVAAIVAVALVGGAVFRSGSDQAAHYSKLAVAGDRDSAQTTAGLGPGLTWDSYLQAADAYPAQEVSPADVQKAEATWDSIAAMDMKGGDPNGAGKKWELVGPTQHALEPGVLSFTGAMDDTASRITALVISPDCKAKGGCKVWAGAAGGGVWRTDDATARDADWEQLNPKDLGQNSVGALVLDPTDKTGNTLYLGTGEANRCTSGCEAGVGIYRSTNAGYTWDTLPDTCGDNAIYKCVSPGTDAFLGRGIGSIVIDPRNGNHIFVGSAQAVRGLSHVIGAGTTVRQPPRANEPGLYESWDGGVHFSEVWDGTKPDQQAGVTGNVSFGINDVGLDPHNLDVVYVSAFDAGLWRRDPAGPAWNFKQVFKPQFVPPRCPTTVGGCGLNGTDRTMFALTGKGAHTRLYLVEGTQPAVNSVTNPIDQNFWRTDVADQSAADLLASQPADLPCVPPDPATHAFPTNYTGWTCLTSQSTASPYFASNDVCTQQCWYDLDVYTPARMPDTVYIIGSNQYGEQPCNTNGVGCGNGRSNGREVNYSTTAGDPDAFANMRTFTDLSYDSTVQHPPWCAYAPYFDNGCENAPNGIHPDQHVIGVNPANPTQIFEGSDGGIIRTSGAFADVSAQCDSPHRNGGGALPPTSGSYLTCKRVLSRVPTLLDHLDTKLGSTIQFVNVAIRPDSDCQVMGGTQDNGTWSNQTRGGGPACDNNTFTQVIYGDGGNAGYDGTNPNWQFNEFTSGFGDSNFRNGDPERWVISTAPQTNSGETFAFYWPQIGDPNPVPGAHPIFSGGQSVWRSWAFGAGVAGHVPQDKTPDIATYEANCQEFVTSGAQLGCGDFRPLGGPYCDSKASNTAGIPDCTNSTSDLTGTAYGSDRAGGQMSWLARDGVDHGTLWAATSAGRIFVTHNADVDDPATVSWHRIDNSLSGNSPTRYPSSIYVDANDPTHAWIGYGGYNATTRQTPGHVFEVREGKAGVAGSGTFTNLNIEAGTAAFPTPTSDGDLPVTDIARDDASRTLYASTDFGVLRGDNDGKGGWHVTTSPRYEVMPLEIKPSSRVPTCSTGKKCKPVLYAATHSQGIWALDLKSNNGNNDDRQGDDDHGGHHHR